MYSVKSLHIGPTLTVYIDTSVILLERIIVQYLKHK